MHALSSISNFEQAERKMWNTAYQMKKKAKSTLARAALMSSGLVWSVSHSSFDFKNETKSFIAVEESAVSTEQR